VNYSGVQIGGNLTRDPELRYGPTGTAIVKFGIAVNRGWTTDSGEKKSKPTFVDVTMFGKRGEAFAKFHKRGDSAFVHGRLEMDSWDDKNTGQKRTKLYVVAEGWEFVGSRATSSGDEPGETPSTEVEETAF
jgi:single-strand DNA-binding protein